MVSEDQGGTSKYLHADGLGTTRAWSNSSGTKTDSLDTDAFGMVVASSGSTPKPFGFAGQHGYQSDSTGLMRLGHRYYDASAGRFISRDPIRAGYNWYTYCQNDPVNNVDPEGLQGGPALLDPGEGGGGGPPPPPENGPGGHPVDPKCRKWHPGDDDHPQDHWDVYVREPGMRSEWWYYPGIDVWVEKPDSADRRKRREEAEENKRKKEEARRGKPGTAIVPIPLGGGGGRVGGGGMIGGGFGLMGKNRAMLFPGVY